MGIYPSNIKEVKGLSMNIETFSYTLFTTIFSMLVVFIFLGILCLIMEVMKYLLKNNSEKERTVGSFDQDLENHEWITAAVSTYVEMEDEESYPCSAEQWKAEQSLTFTPWLSGNFTNRKIGTYK